MLQPGSAWPAQLSFKEIEADPLYTSAQGALAPGPPKKPFKTQAPGSTQGSFVRESVCTCRPDPLSNLEPIYEPL